MTILTGSPKSGTEVTATRLLDVADHSIDDDGEDGLPTAALTDLFAPGGDLHFPDLSAYVR